MDFSHIPCMFVFTFLWLVQKLDNQWRWRMIRVISAIAICKAAAWRQRRGKHNCCRALPPLSIHPSNLNSPRAESPPLRTEARVMNSVQLGRASSLFSASRFLLWHSFTAQLIANWPPRLARREQRLTFSQWISPGWKRGGPARRLTLAPTLPRPRAQMKCDPQH